MGSEAHTEDSRGTDRGADRRGGHRGSGRARDGAARLRNAVEVTRTVAEQLAVLTGRVPDGISRMERTDDGWLLHAEVVDLERIPPTTSVLATYEVRADPDGDVTSYERIRRYTRNQVEGG